MDAKDSFLPAEVVRVILLYVYNNQDAVTLTSCQCVNKTWYREGRAIRWAHVRVASEDLESFCHILQSLENNDRSPLNLITSFHIKQEDTYHELEDSPPYDTQKIINLLGIEEWLPKMLNLRTFSYKSFEYDDRHIGIGSDLISGVILPVKSLNLCRAIQNLEIDLVTISSLAYSRDNHLCVAIQQILPHLRRLKYTRQPCCFEMFKDLKIICPKLEEIVIDVDVRDVREPCTEEEPLTFEATRGAIDSLITAAREVVERGLMPNLTYFVIYGRSLNKSHQSRYLIHPYDNDDPEEHTFSCFYRIDILRRKTTVFPSHLGEGIHPNTMEKLHRKVKPVMKQNWMLYKDFGTGRTHDLIGNLDDLQALIYERTWLESSNKVRLPAQEAHRSTDLRWPEQTTLDQLIANFKSMRSTHRVQSRLWFLQERLGRPLLEVKEFDGMFYPEMPSRERVENDWVYFDEVNYMDRNILNWTLF